jgi:hypothetical protein
MSDKHVVLTENAPPTLPGIYSQAIVASGFVYCSSCVPMDAQTGKIVDGDIKMHTVGLFCHYLGAVLTLIVLASMHQKYIEHSRSRWFKHHQGRQIQCLPVQHGRFCGYEFGLYALLG